MSIDVLPGNAADEEQSVGDIGRKGMDGNDEKRKRGKEEGAEWRLSIRCIRRRQKEEELIIWRRNVGRCGWLRIYGHVVVAS